VRHRRSEAEVADRELGSSNQLIEAQGGAFHQPVAAVIANQKKIGGSYAHFITHIRMPPKIVGFFRGWSGARAFDWGGLAWAPLAGLGFLAFLFVFFPFTHTASRISDGASIQLWVIAFRKKRPGLLNLFLTSLGIIT
jgi:hypothetical protein